jgi:EAL domain-containing protein (putative c-di-GMP-specific phosphodiesterase class I)
LLPPAAFIPAVEGGPLELAVGDWVIATALDQLELWQQQGLRLQLGVNVGPGQLMGLGFAQRLKQQLDRRPAIAASALELEIVESTAFSDFEQATQVMEACRALGVRFALDDFGTGYSSLAHFRTLPVDRLKIDKSFVRDMLHDPGDMEIVESVVRLAQAFDRAVIAEGIETLEHAALLPSLSCRCAQGYGIARPMPAAQLPEWIDDWAAQPRLPLAEETWGHHDVRLVVATQHYLRWLEAVASLLEDESRPNDQRSSTVECTFGQWYRGRGFARYGELAEYEVVGAVHERSHALVDELLALARGGQSEAARALLHELKALRDELLAAMSALMRRVRESEGRQAAEAGIAPDGADAPDSAA